jgi:hypothetical protein
VLTGEVQLRDWQRPDQTESWCFGERKGLDFTAQGGTAKDGQTKLSCSERGFLSRIIYMKIDTLRYRYWQSTLRYILACMTVNLLGHFPETTDGK